MNTDEIKAKYLTWHNTLGSRKDAVDKAKFDIDHAKIWSDCDAELKKRKVAVQAKSKLSSGEVAELSKLNMLFPEPVIVTDLRKEIDELKARIDKLESAKVV